MVFQHPILNHSELQLILFVKLLQILRQYRGIDLSRHRPVIFIFMSGLQRAGHQIMNVISRNNIKPVDMRQTSQRVNLPFPILIRFYHNDSGFFGIIGRIEFMRRQKYAV